MLQEILEVKRAKSRVFQVLLLQNNASQDVEVQEAEEVDFLSVQDHLARGGSVFITSKNRQKIKLPEEKERVPRNKNKMRTVTVTYFSHV